MVIFHRFLYVYRRVYSSGYICHSQFHADLDFAMWLDVGQNGGISIDQHPAGLFHHDESANAEMLRVTSTFVGGAPDR